MQNKKGANIQIRRMINKDDLQDKLIGELEKLIVLLEKHEESSWTSTLLRVQDLIDNGDIRGLDFLTNMHAGMGSFNDLIICQMNGHKIEKHEEPFANSELERLGKLAASLALSLKRELNKI